MVGLGMHKMSVDFVVYWSKYWPYINLTRVIIGNNDILENYLVFLEFLTFIIFSSKNFNNFFYNLIKKEGIQETKEWTRKNLLH